MRKVILIVEVNDECGLTNEGLTQYFCGELKASDASGDGYVKEIYAHEVKRFDYDPG